MKRGVRTLTVVIDGVVRERSAISPNFRYLTMPLDSYIACPSAMIPFLVKWTVADQIKGGRRLVRGSAQFSKMMDRFIFCSGIIILLGNSKGLVTKPKSIKTQFVLRKVENLLTSEWEMAPQIFKSNFHFGFCYYFALYTFFILFFLVMAWWAL